MSVHKKSLKPADYVKTPQWLLDEIGGTWEGEIFDPCPSNPTFDGLTIDWKSVNYCNPPYSQKQQWIEKGLYEHKKGRTVIFLLPVDTSTKWFKELAEAGARFLFLYPRTHFSKGSPWFASMLVVLDEGDSRTNWITDKWIELGEDGFD